MITDARLFFRNGFNIGDWIEIPELNIDGPIEEITSFSVVVKNWDNTKTNIPMGIYTFINTTECKKYEDIQSDIFDFLLSSINKFDLKVYQVS